jgi:hypothetical protein
LSKGWNLIERFSAPIEISGSKTADYYDAEVIIWRKEKAKEIYARIPDFGGKKKQILRTNRSAKLWQKFSQENLFIQCLGRCLKHNNKEAKVGGMPVFYIFSKFQKMNCQTVLKNQHKLWTIINP